MQEVHRMHSDSSVRRVHTTENGMHGEAVVRARLATK